MLHVLHLPQQASIVDAARSSLANSKKVDASESSCTRSPKCSANMPATPAATHPTAKIRVNARNSHERAPDTNHSPPMPHPNNITAAATGSRDSYAARCNPRPRSTSARSDTENEVVSAHSDCINLLAYGVIEPVSLSGNPALKDGAW